jgi:hypothetical protein
MAIFWEFIMVVGEFYLCMVFDELGGGMVVWLFMGTTSIHTMPNLSQAMHVHVLGKHVHCINFPKIVISWGQLC